MADPKDSKSLATPTTAADRAALQERKEETAMQRAVQYELAERREQVAKLRLKGLSMREVAKELNVSLKTIQRDTEALREENAKTIDEFEQNTYMGEAMARFQEIEERAWHEYNVSVKVHEKIKALDLVRTLQNDKMKALKDVGLLRGEKHHVEVTHTHQLDWSDEMKDRVSRALLNQSLTPQLEAPVHESEIIDVTPVEGDDETGV